MRSRLMMVPPAASVMPSMRPSTWSGTPHSMRSGGSPSRLGQLCRTSSTLPPMPPEVTITACALSTNSPTTPRELGAPRSTEVGSSMSPRTPSTTPALLVSSLTRWRKHSVTSPCGDALAHAAHERRDDAGACAPGDVEARHRVAVLGRRVAAALGPADDREPAHASGLQPRPLLAGRERHVGLRPALRPVILGAIEARRAHPVLQRQVVRVADAQAPLLGAVDEHQPAERPERLAAQRLLALLVEQDHLAAGIDQLAGRRPGRRARRRRRSRPRPSPLLPSVSSFKRVAGHLFGREPRRAPARSLGLAHEAATRAFDRHRHTDLRRHAPRSPPADSRSRSAAAAPDPPTSTSAPRDRSPACAAPPAGTRQSGRRRMKGIRPRRHASRSAPGECRSPSTRRAPPRSAQRAAAASADRPAPSPAAGRDSAFSALLRLNSSLPHCTPCMSACSATATPGTSSSDAQAGDTRADQQRAAGGAMKARSPIRLARLHDVEGHHAADHHAAWLRAAPSADRHCRHRSAG